VVYYIEVNYMNGGDLNMTKKSLIEETGCSRFALIVDGNDIWLWGFDKYPRHSVLAGQFKQQRIEVFDSMNDARQKYPWVLVSENHPLPSAWMNTVPVNSPSDFDPSYAGETW